MRAVAGSVGGENLTDFTDVALGRQPIRHFGIRPVGTRWSDFIWVGVVPVVSGRVKQALAKARITGWTPFDVSIVDKSGSEKFGYVGLRVEGRVKHLSLDRTSSKVVYEVRDHGAFPRYQGLNVDPNTWDGSDIFTAADDATAYIVVTERVRDVLVDGSFTNYELIDVNDVSMPAVDLMPR